MVINFGHFYSFLFRIMSTFGLIIGHISHQYKRRKTFGEFFRSYSELISTFCEISFLEYVSEGISHPVSYGDLVYKLRGLKGAANFVSSGSKLKKKRFRR